MKKVVIFALFALIGISPVLATCKINALGICTNKVSPTSGFGTTNIKEKILPNRMDNIRIPNSSHDNRTLQGQQRTPSQINRDLIQQKTDMPYDANCQFGNCINRTNSNGNNNNF